MDLEQLQYFQVVAETLNFTEAAAQVHLSQPALSRSIQRLEEEFGQPFFERKPRSLELTDAGLRFQKCALEILRIVEDTKSEINDDGQTGKVRIGAIPTIAPYFLPDLLRQFSSAFPLARMIVYENTTEELLKACKQGSIDLAILAAPVEEKYVEVEELLDEELFLMLPPEHALATQEKIRVADVQELPFVMLDEAHCLSDNIISFCRQKSVHPVVIERTSQLTTIQELVALGHGVSMMPAMAQRRDQGPERVYRSFVRPCPKRTVVSVMNPYRFQSRLFGEFRKCLTKFAADFK